MMSWTCWIDADHSEELQSLWSLGWVLCWSSDLSLRDLAGVFLQHSDEEAVRIEGCAPFPGRIISFWAEFDGEIATQLGHALVLFEISSWTVRMGEDQTQPFDGTNKFTILTRRRTDAADTPTTT